MPNADTSLVPHLSIVLSEAHTRLPGTPSLSYRVIKILHHICRSAQRRHFQYQLRSSRLSPVDFNLSPAKRRPREFESMGFCITDAASLHRFIAVLVFIAFYSLIFSFLYIIYLFILCLFSFLSLHIYSHFYFPSGHIVLQLLSLYTHTYIYLFISHLVALKFNMGFM